MEIDERTKARLDRERHEKCAALAQQITQAVDRLNELLSSATEIELSVRIESEISKSGTRAFRQKLLVSCAEILP